MEKGKSPEGRLDCIKGVHEPIIEENVFWQVQDLIAEHGKVSANAGRYNAKGNRENILERQIALRRMWKINGVM